MSAGGPGRSAASESRRSTRYPLAPYGGEVAVVGAQLVDMSAHGVSIESLVPMEGEAVLPLRLIVSGNKVDVEARVVQCVAARGARRRLYRVGLEFVSLPVKARERIVEILKAGAAAAPAAPEP